jgi:hypothetical protein
MLIGYGNDPGGLKSMAVLFSAPVDVLPEPLGKTVGPPLISAAPNPALVQIRTKNLVWLKVQRQLACAFGHPPFWSTTGPLAPLPTIVVFVRKMALSKYE